MNNIEKIFNLTEHEKYKIAILDDNQMFTENLKENLEELLDDGLGKFELMTYNNISPLYINNQIRTIDLLIIDYQLGEINNGIEVIRDLRNKLYTMPIILMTGEEVTELKERNQEIKNITFVEKGKIDFFENIKDIVEDKLINRLDIIHEKITHYLHLVNEVFYEREEVARLNILALFAAENIFYLGPPGTGKSAIVETVIKSLPKVPTFRQLMTEFTKYDTIFGEVLTDEIGRKRRDLEKGVVAAFIIFLDEIFKSSDQILNAFLTLLNEKKFDDFGRVVQALLRTCIAASNEFPRTSYLNALYDRFFLKILVPQVQKEENIAKLLTDEEEVKILDEMPEFSLQDLYFVDTHVQKVNIPDSIIKLFFHLRECFYKRLNASSEIDNLNKVYEFSSRTVRKAGKVFKVSAFLNKRMEVDVSDLFLLQYSTWANISQKSIIEASIRNEMFGDRDNMIESLILLLNKFTDYRKRYTENFAVIFEFRKELTVDSYNKACQDISVILKENQEYTNSFLEVIQLMEMHSELSNKIKQNILLHAEAIIPWDLNNEIYYIETIGELNQVIARENKGTFKSHCIKALNELKDWKLNIEKFKTIEDYFTYNFEYQQRNSRK